MDNSLAIGIHAAVLRLPFDENLFENLNDYNVEPRYKTLFGKNQFISACRKMYPHISESEASNIYQSLMCECKPAKNKEGGVFSLIRQLAKFHLRMSGSQLHCRHENFIPW